MSDDYPSPEQYAAALRALERLQSEFESTEDHPEFYDWRAGSVGVFVAWEEGDYEYTLENDLTEDGWEDPVLTAKHVNHG
jgi:hypothetical protein